MKSLLKLGTLFSFATALMYAANVNGRLVDANCYQNNAQIAIAGDQTTYNQLAQMCPANNTSTSFVVMTNDGKVYRLDDKGNSKAMEAMKSGEIKPDQNGNVNVTVSGSMGVEQFLVDTVTGNSK